LTRWETETVLPKSYPAQVMTVEWVVVVGQERGKPVKVNAVSGWVCSVVVESECSV